MFTQSTHIYDHLYLEHKDYKSEAEKIDFLIKQLNVLPSTILDVACGTGEHAKMLNTHHGHSVDGIDIEPGFVEIASRENPGNVFQVADMTAFELNRSYDMILCLFSSIGYVQTVEKLTAAIQCMSNHLNTNCYLLLEPWLEPQSDLSDLNTCIESIDPKTNATICRTRIARVEKNLSILEIEYTIKTDRDVKTLQETHILGMFTQQEIQDALKSAGFVFTYAEQGLHNKGTYLAKKVAP